MKEGRRALAGREGDAAASNQDDLPPSDHHLPLPGSLPSLDPELPANLCIKDLGLKRRRTEGWGRESNWMEIGCLCQQICSTNLLYFALGAPSDPNPMFRQSRKVFVKTLFQGSHQRWWDLWWDPLNEVFTGTCGGTL